MNQLLFLKTQLGHVQLEIGFVQKSKHYLLSKQGWQHRHPKIHLLALGLEFNATILRQAAFCNIKPGHDLDPREKCVSQLHRRLHYFVKDSINTVTYPKTLFIGFNMDVTGHLLDCIH